MFNLRSVHLLFIILLIIAYLPAGRIFGLENSLEIKLGVTEVSTTTPPEAPIVPPAGPKAINQIPLITSLQVLPDLTSARLFFETNKDVRTEVVWGETVDYEAGTAVSGYYLSRHEVRLSSLQPGRRYYYHISIYDPIGGKNFYGPLQFTTLTQPRIKTELPANVVLITVAREGNDLRISWLSPTEDDFAGVRILRSTLHFPRGVTDGELVYEGSDRSFLDRDFRPNQIFYYTIFAYDVAGNYASGAMLAVKNFESVCPASAAGQSIKTGSDLRLTDFEFWQAGAKLEPISGELKVNGGKNLTVTLAAKKIITDSTEIILNLRPLASDQMTASYYLIYNAKTERHEATIAPLAQPVILEAEIIAFDYLNHEFLGRFTLTLNIFLPPGFKPPSLYWPAWLGGRVTGYLVNNYFLLVIIGILLILPLLFFRKKKEK